MTTNPVLTLLEFTAKAGVRLDRFLLETGACWDEIAPWPQDRMRGEMGECYSNASLLSWETGWEYVEGMASTTGLGIPMWHAWCLDDQGRVVDPTWADGENYFGVIIPRDVSTVVTSATEWYGVLTNLWAYRGSLDLDDILFRIAEANNAID